MWKVRDVMEKDVVTVPPDMPVRDLVQILAKQRISGAPVIGAEGEILGVVSATDVMALAAYGADAHVGDPRQDEEGAMDEESAWYFRSVDTPFDFEAKSGEAAEYLVEDIMTPAAFSVRADDTVRELARFLLRGRIHRALVLDEGSLCGIVTTFDVLQAVATMIDEPSAADVAMAGA